MQAGAFVRSYDDFAARHALHLGNRDQHGLAGVESFLDILLEGFATRGQRDFAAGAVEQLGSDFLFQRANLRRNGGLGAETLLRRARERSVPRHFEEGFELIKVHGASAGANDNPSNDNPSL